MICCTVSDETKIDCDMGSVLVQDGSYALATVNGDAGELRWEKADVLDLTMDADLGSIVVDCSNIDDLSVYEITADTDLGSLTMDGRSYKQLDQDGDGTHAIHLTNNMGSIDVVTQ